MVLQLIFVLYFQAKGSSYVLMQICRVEDVIVEGLIEGSIIHFHWVRTVAVKPSGEIIASGLGISDLPVCLFIFVVVLA